MRAAGRIAIAVAVLVLALQIIPSSVHPSDTDEEGQIEIVGVLCGTITQETQTLPEFYVTCSVTVQAGVTLWMSGMGYMSPGVSITVYGDLMLGAFLDWNTTSPPPDPDAWRWNGIDVRASGHIEAIGFTISHTRIVGLFLGTPNNTVRYGFFEDVVPLGMSDGYALYVGSDSNLIENVEVLSSFGGLKLEDATGNVVKKSRFSSVSRGIMIGYTYQTSGNSIVCSDFQDNTNHVVALRGEGNLIHHNNFYGSGFAYEERWNVWDDGYPNGGNYWADYVGNDSFRGPNQDFPGPDGIGDEPYDGIYNFDSGNYDNYPFMNPVPKTSCPSPPPEMPKGPLPPYNITAELEGLSLSDVNISWELSWDDGSPDFHNYAIYYNEDFDNKGLGYRYLAEISPGNSFYVHSAAGHGNPPNYFYYVQANDSSGIPGRSPNQVAKFTKSLLEGWNLVSIPLSMDDMRLECVLQTANVERALAYASSTGEWKEYNTQKSYRNLESLTLSHGIWVETSQSGYMTIAGRVPSSTSIDLVPGWNLVGYPSFIEQDVSSSLSGTSYGRVEAFNPGAWPHYLKVLQPGDVMAAGNGYWIRVSESCTWVVEN
jgi:hypothetical protein